MKESSIINEEYSKDEYNSEPVVFCKKCLSLKILSINDEIDYCDDCGSTDIDTANIEDWEEMYKKKYGKTFINK